VVFEELQNFPEDVIEQWIKPYAELSGWPPKVGLDGVPADRWRYLLSLKPLSWWQNGEWVKCKGSLSIHDLSEGSRDSIIKMAFAYLTGAENEYSLSMSDMRERLDKISEYLQSHKRLPCNPILYEGVDGISVADGNHRLCMLYIFQGYFKLPVPEHMQVLVDKEIEYWIYRPVPIVG